MERENRKCFICGNEGYRIISVSHRNTFVDIKYCAACGLFYTNPLIELNFSDNQEYYSDISNNKRRQKLQEWKVKEPSVAVASKEVARRKVEFLLNFLDEHNPQNIDILDVGCNQGFFLYICKSMGLDTFGVELSVNLVKKAREYLGLNVHCGYLEKTDFKNQKFDIVHISHVLEHVANPVPFIERSVDLVKQGGLLYIAVPNEAALTYVILRKLGFSISTINVPFHLYGYTKKALKKIFVDTYGLKTMAIFTYSKGDKMWWQREPDIDSFSEFYGGIYKFLFRKAIEPFEKIFDAQTCIVVVFKR